MTATLIPNLAASSLALALAANGASAQTVITRTINSEPVETVVVPRQQVVVAPPIAPAPYIAPAPFVQRQVALPVAPPPILAADEEVIVQPSAPITVGTVLPRNVPLYAVPQNVALGVPATRAYSYAWLGGRAYLVDPATGAVMADVTE
jgi:hypothetical protein